MESLFLEKEENHLCCSTHIALLRSIQQLLQDFVFEKNCSVQKLHNQAFFFFFLKFIYFWLCWIFVALCGLPPVVVSRGSLRCGAWTSLLAEHRLLARGRQRLHLEGSRAQASLLHGTWNLPAPGIKPLSLASAGGFLTTAPPGKSRLLLKKKNDSGV